jgi:hypothetical protein
MATYWVIGGEYASTDFREMLNGGEPQTFGPFASYDEARAVWLAKSWANVDNCHARFTIVQGDKPSTSPSSAAA